MIDLKQVPIINNYIYSRTIDGCIVILDAKHYAFHRLNKIGSIIFKQIKKKKTIKEIITAIDIKFNVFKYVAKRDCLNFIYYLNKKNIITLPSKHRTKNK